MQNANSSFQKIKSLHGEVITKTPQILQQEQTCYSTVWHASLKGLGACIIQEGQPIVFVSKSLTDTETHYANIERELLAIMYLAARNSTHTYMEEYLIMKTDHKPLEMISLKNLIAAPVRLQWMLLRLQQYDLIIIYRPGKEMLLSDALSHLPSRTDTADPARSQGFNAISMSAFTHSHLTKIAAETQKDLILSTVHRLTLNGWPNKCTNVPRITRSCWDFRDKLSIWQWLADERRESSHSDTLQKWYYGRSSQKPCRHQQSYIPSQDMQVLARHGSRCNWLSQKYAWCMHRQQQSTDGDIAPTWGPTRTLGSK